MLSRSKSFILIIDSDRSWWNRAVVDLARVVGWLAGHTSAQASLGVAKWPCLEYHVE